jgi:hypothetical protein
MKILHSAEFTLLIKKAKLRPRLQRELRFNTSVAGLSAEDWTDTELLAITDRNGTKGVLILQPYEELFIVPYELSRGLTTTNGRAQAIICDFCYTWQAGSNAAAISFKKDPNSLNSTRFLCCADLGCSNHVRNKSTVSRLSRANLRETMTNEQRVARLKQRLQTTAQNLELPEISLT